MQAGKWGVEVKVFYLRNMRRVLQVTPPILTKGKPSPVCVFHRDGKSPGRDLEGSSPVSISLTQKDLGMLTKDITAERAAEAKGRKLTTSHVPVTN